ncbi:MAG: hypothetical protein LAP85_26370 [Acidobacteriia bacterium]|nr:hypothetical protein [Terriglobia bacterium]
MRTVAIKLIGILALGSGTAFAQGAQNRDLSFLAGPLSSTSQVIPGSDVTVTTATGLVFQYSSSYQIHSTKAGDLYVELPFTFVFPGKSVASGASGSSHFMTHYLAPGVRFKIPLSDRVSFYGLFGGGYGSFRRYELVSDPTTRLHTHVTLRGVFDFGGGVDFRLSRLFSLRGEVRDFIGGSGLSGTPGRHHLVSIGGLALHF